MVVFEVEGPELPGTARNTWDRLQWDGRAGRFYSEKREIDGGYTSSFSPKDGPNFTVSAFDAGLSARINVIRYRKTWIDKDGRIFSDYEQAGGKTARSWIQAVVRFRSGEPWLFSAKGSVSRSFEVLLHFVSKRLEVTSGRYLGKAGLPPSLWWVSVGSTRQQVGTGRTKMTMVVPELFSPATDVTDAAGFSAHYVGKELHKKNAALYRELDGWVQQWR